MKLHHYCGMNWVKLMKWAAINVFGRVSLERSHHTMEIHSDWVWVLNRDLLVSCSLIGCCEGCTSCDSTWIADYIDDITSCITSKATGVMMTWIITGKKKKTFNAPVTTPWWYPFSTEVAKQQRPMWVGDIISRVDEHSWLYAGKGQHKQTHIRPMVHQGILEDIFNRGHRLKWLQQLVPQSVRVVSWLQDPAAIS